MIPTRAIAVAAVALLAACSSSETTGAPRLATLNVSVTPTALRVGRTSQATVTGVDQFGAAIPTGAVRWSSSAPNVASIDAGGVLTGVAVGSTTITATAGNVSGTATVAVTAAPALTTIELEFDAPRIAASTSTYTVLNGRDQYGQPMPFTGAAVWSSSNPQVATVNSIGLVTGISAGTSIISANAAGKSAQATITVTPHPFRVRFTGTVPETVTLGETIEVQLSVVDVNDNPPQTGNVIVSALQPDGNGTRFTAITDALGAATMRLTFRGVAGRRTMVFSAPNSAPLLNTFTLLPGRAEVVTRVSGNDQTAAVGAEVAVPPRVRVTDIDGNPVQGAPVSFMIRLGGGTLTGASTTTNANGEASLGSWRLGDVGTNVLLAIVTTTGAEVEFNATGVPRETVSRGSH